MDKKRNIISVKFSDKELDLIDNYAYETGRRRSTYIRDVVLGKPPRQKPPEEFYEILKMLRYMSSNLNQLAIKANKLKMIDELQYKKEVEILNQFILDVKNKFLR